MAKNRIIPVFVPHVGCPHRCVFCNQNRISGAQRPVTAAEVDTTILEALPRCGFGAELAFYGGSFTAIPTAMQQSLLEAVQPYLETGEICGIRLSTRPDAIDREKLELLKQYGVQTVELGCQSMEESVLEQTHRGHHAEDVYQAVSLLRQYGFSVILQMMTGLPGDTVETALQTGEQLADLRPDGVRIYPTVVVRDTALCDAYGDGTYVPPTMEETVSLCARLFRLFLKRQVPVLRIGLQPTEELSGGGAVAGAYHPALGEMVKSRVFRELAEKQMEEAEGHDSAVLLVAPQRISMMVGQKRCNLQYLSEKYNLTELRVKGQEMADWSVTVQWNDNRI